MSSKEEIKEVIDKINENNPFKDFAVLQKSFKEMYLPFGLVKLPKGFFSENREKLMGEILELVKKYMKEFDEKLEEKILNKLLYGKWEK